jgi:hypothetical protein
MIDRHDATRHCASIEVVMRIVGASGLQHCI